MFRGSFSKNRYHTGFFFEKSTVPIFGDFETKHFKFQKVPKKSIVKQILMLNMDPLTHFILEMYTYLLHTLRLKRQSLLADQRRPA